MPDRQNHHQSNLSEGLKEQYVKERIPSNHKMARHDV